MPAMSRDPEAWKKASEAARAQRVLSAAEVAGVIAAQVAELVVEGDVMGGPGMFAQRVRTIAEAQRRGDPLALRAAVMDAVVAGGAWVANLDFDPPLDLRGNGASADA